MSKRVAVDIVLIPPKEILELAIKTNNKFPDTAAENYILGPKTCIPHITLLMGLAEKKKLGQVSQTLNGLAKKTPPLNLSISAVDIHARPDGKKISGFRIEKTPKLQNLHETLLAQMHDLFSYDGVAKEMFYSPPPLDSVPNYWVQGFAKNKVRENYEPHITLGFGLPEKMDYPIKFTTSDLALYHLGNHCTCRKILMKTKLSIGK